MIRSIGTCGVSAGLVIGLGLLAAAPAHAQSSCGNSWTVSVGDTLYEIAQSCGTSVSALVQANEQVTDPNRIRVGWTLTIPGQQDADRGDSGPAAPREESGSYTVQPGDTLYVIARQLGTTVADLLAANTGIDPRRLGIGQVIRLPGDAPPPDRGNGAVEVTGVLTREGVECPALRSDTGELYTLAGETDPFGPGDRVRVRGTRPDVSTCQQGTTINVRSIEAAP